MQSKRVISTLIAATLLSASCSKIFQNRDSELAPSFNITDIDSSRDYTPHPDVDINKEDSKILDNVVDSLPERNPADTMQIVTDSICVDSTALEAPQFTPFTDEQSSKMVIAEYIGAEFDDISIDLSQSASHYPTDPRHVTSPYGWRRGRMHAGIDLKVDKGDNIYAAFDGVVRLAKYYGAYGYCIILRHENGLETLYGHSSKLLVDVNDHVKAGDVIALGGSTGRSTGAHCHFETRIQGIYFDPNLVIDTKTSSVKQANLHIAKRGNRLFASNNDNKEAREAYILEQITIKYYTVRSGDVLSRIAARNNTTVTKLCQINGISSKSTLRIGQRLIVREGIKTPIKSTTTETSTEKKSQTATAASTAASTPNQSQQQSQSAPTFTYTVKSGDTLGEIAQEHNVSASTLCMLNGIRSNSTLQVGQRLKIPGQAPTTTPATTQKSSAKYHTVRSGDSLSKIASNYGTTVSKLCSINGISSTSTLSIGQKIYLTATTASTSRANSSSSSKATHHTVRSGDNLSSIAKRYGTTVSELCAINNISSSATLQIGQKIELSGSTSISAPTSTSSLSDGYHIVRSGDTLSGIAAKYDTSVSELCRLNNITSRTTLHLEQKIKIK